MNTLRQLEKFLYAPLDDSEGGEDAFSAFTQLSCLVRQR